MNGAELAILQDLLTQAGTQTALLQRMVSLMGGGAGSGGSGGGGGAQTANNIKGLGVAASIAGVAAQTLGYAFNKLTSIVGTVGSWIGSFIGHIVNLGENFVAFTKKAMEGQARLSDFIDVFKDLPVIGKVFSIFSDIARVGQNYLDLYRRTATVGATFSGSLFDISNQASRAGLGLNDFVNVITQNSETLAAFGGGNINTGIERFTQASGKLLGPGSPYARGIMGLGFTADQAASGLATVMKMQGITSRENQASSDQLAKYTHQYLMELDMLAKLTGKRRDQVQREIDEVEADQLFMTFIDSLSPDEAAVKMAMVQAAAPYGKGMVDQVKALLRGLDLPVNEAGENLAVMSNGASLNGQALRKAATAANGDTKKATESMLGWLAQTAIAARGTLDKFSDAQKASGMLTGMVSNEMIKLGRTLKPVGDDMKKVLTKISKDQDAAAIGSAGALGLLELRFTQFGSRIRELMNIALSPLLEKIIQASEGVFKFINDMLGSEKFKKIVEDVVKWFDTAFKELQEAYKKDSWAGVFKKLGEKIIEGGTNVGEFLSPLFESLKPAMASMIESLVSLMEPHIKKSFNWMMDQMNAYFFKETKGVIGEDPRFRGLNRASEEQREIVQKTMAEIAKLRSEGSNAEANIKEKELDRIGKEFGAWFMDSMRLYNKDKSADFKPFMPTPSRATGSLGMTGKLFENWGAGTQATLHGTESVMTPEQMISMVSGAANSELINTLKDLNNTNAQLLVQAKITAENSRRTYDAVKVLNPDLFQMA
jgi:hypothetical protein